MRRAIFEDLPVVRILVISLAGIGDTLFATPLLRELRMQFPSALIDVFVLWPGARDILRDNPHLDNLHQFNLIEGGKWKGLGFLKALRSKRYDISINTFPQSRIHYRWVARIIGAKKRLSHRYDNFGLLDSMLATDSIPQDYSIHCVENNLRLLSLLGKRPLLSENSLEIFVAPAEEAWAGQYLRNLNGRLVVGLHVGSGTTKNLAARRWPLAHYRELIKRTCALRPDVSFLLFGGPGESAENSELQKDCGTDAVLCPVTPSLQHAAALIGRCNAFISVDTALMHIAACRRVKNQICIDTPTFNKTVEPYRQSFIKVDNPFVKGNHLHYYRYDGAGIQLTSDELQRCMSSVRVDEVLEVLLKKLPPKA